MEVLLVLAILVILGTLVVANFSGCSPAARSRRPRPRSVRLEQQMDIYQLDVGSYPTTQQGLQALRDRAAGSG